MVGTKQKGRFVGAGHPVGFLIFGPGLLLPWMSWPQLVGVGVVVGLPAWLCIPAWFLVLGRHLGRRLSYRPAAL